MIRECVNEVTNTRISEADRLCTTCRNRCPNPDLASRLKPLLMKMGDQPARVELARSLGSSMAKEAIAPAVTFVYRARMLRPSD
jgi:hypothetical protein